MSAFMADFQSVTVPPLTGGGRRRFKGSASVAVDPGDDKRRDNGHQAEGGVALSFAFHFRNPLPSPRSPYPQKLWITLWVSILGWVKFPGHIAYLLQWLKNDHPFLSCFINNLR
jgi:hypothetical protein